MVMVRTETVKSLSQAGSAIGEPIRTAYLHARTGDMFGLC